MLSHRSYPAHKKESQLPVFEKTLEFVRVESLQKGGLN